MALRRSKVDPLSKGVAPTKPVVPSRDTSLERETRKACGFEECECDLPNIKRPTLGGDSSGSLAEDLLSHLGRWNPLARNVAATDTLWILDNTAWRDPASGQWEAEFVTAAFHQDHGVGVDDVVAAVADKLGIAKDDASREIIRQRIDMFTRDILPGRKVLVDFVTATGKTKRLELGPGNRQGISSDVRRLPPSDAGVQSANKANVPEGADGILDFKTLFAYPDGWGLISDIDDTIKITQTSSPLGILHSTFVAEANPIPGMPTLYAWMRTLLEPDAARQALVFYLSASPYNLYPFLRDFRDQHYPPGQIILRDASWMNLAGLLSNLTLGVQDYKVSRIEKIHGWFPRRKMICIGDSTQSDPETYAEIFKKYPDWVRLILIRRVDDVPAAGHKTQAERFDKAFAEVPRSMWRVFKSPDECRQIIEETIKGDP